MKFRPTDVHGWLSDWVTAVGASPFLQLRSGPEEASTAATATGTLIAEIPLPASPFTTPSGGIIEKSGSWSVNSAATGVIGHGRILDNAKTTCLFVGSVSQAVAYTLTATAAAATNVLTVADTSGAFVGSGVAGRGIAAGTTVVALTTTTITISQVVTASLTTSDFVVVGDTSGDILISGAYIPSAGTTVTVAAWAMGWPSLI
jgi:hypothetical protein